ncbi:MAG TPA: ATP-binding cassette domain-containing protein, partial [Candidatus Dormibacteraeota bacterium]|nr:ATP-binding cassette domain-containing protein [Candidatus Dormibacteraeota bacterium]
TIRAPGPGTRVEHLSGGNQQKVLLARLLTQRPRLLLLAEPTRGVDVGAKEEIHRLVFELADTGVPIVVVSSELPEVVRLADRVMVMRQGRLAAEYARETVDPAVVLNAAIGEEVGRAVV